MNSCADVGLIAAKNCVLAVPTQRWFWP